MTMIHAFISFLIEKLWQRFPRRKGNKISPNTIAAYPEENESFNDPAAEARYELLVNTSKGIRSFTAEHKLQERTRAYIQALDDAIHKILTTFTSFSSIRYHVRKAMREVSDPNIRTSSNPTPTNYAVDTVSPKATIFININCHVDMDTEIARDMTNVHRGIDAVLNQEKTMVVPDYRDQASETVKEWRQGAVEGGGNRK